MSKVAMLTDRVWDLEARLSAIEIAVMRTPSQASQAAVDVVAQTEIARLRKRVFVLTQAIRVHRDALAAAESAASQNPRLRTPRHLRADAELWACVAEADGTRR